jgi:hypothetical protein
LFTPQEHPTTIVEDQDTHQGLPQTKEHVFQGFGMLSSSYLFQGEPFNEICNTK